MADSDARRTSLNVTAEISATCADGFHEQVVRVITENAAALEFEPGAGFKEH